MEIQTTMLLDVINPYILVSIGIALIAIESVMLSFVMVWFGIGFVLIGLLSFYYDFSNGYNQLALVSLISLCLLFLLKKRVVNYVKNSSSETINENYFDELGTGVIKNGLVFYKGTYFEINEDCAIYKDGEKVKVESVNKNIITISKIKNEER